MIPDTHKKLIINILRNSLKGVFPTGAGITKLV